MTPMTLSEIIAPHREALLDDCVALIDHRVQLQKGLSALALKSGYQLVVSLKPLFLREVLDEMLDDFVVQLEPFYARYLSEESAPALPVWMEAHSEEIAQALLSVSDARRERSRHPMLAKFYVKLRPSAKVQVEAALPDLGVLIERYSALPF